MKVWKVVNDTGHTVQGGFFTYEEAVEFAGNYYHIEEQAVRYNVWIEIEVYDENEDWFEDIGEPMSVAHSMGSYDEARQLQMEIVESYKGILI